MHRRCAYKENRISCRYVESEGVMATDLREAVKDYSDEQLVRMITREREDYTSQAIAIIETELDRRNIDAEKRQKLMDELKAPVTHSKEDFEPLEHRFGHTDLLLITAMLKEHTVPYFVEAGTNTSDIIPTEALTERTYQVFVLKDRLPEVHELVEEHFTWVDGVYQLKAQGPKGQIKALSFFDIGLEGAQLDENVQVEFSEQEQYEIQNLAKRLREDVDRLEREEGRTVFHYDNLENLIAKLGESGNADWTIGDVLTILEVLQVYCDDPAFPSDLDETITGLLDFFRSIEGK